MTTSTERAEVMMRSRARHHARALVGLVLGLVLWAGWSAAAGADDRKVAGALMATGTELYNSGAYADALAKFQEALKLVPEANGPRRAIGLTLHKLERCGEALAPLRTFLERKGGDSSEVAEVREALDACERILEERTTMSVTSDVTGATVRLDSPDGYFLGTTPLKKVRIVPGSHTLYLAAGGHESAEIATEAVLGADTAVHVILSAVGHAALTKPVIPAKKRRSPWLWVGIGGGAALIAAGVVTGVILGTSNAGRPDVELRPPFRL